MELKLRQNARRYDFLLSEEAFDELAKPPSAVVLVYEEAPVADRPSFTPMKWSYIIGSTGTIFATNRKV